MLQIARIVRSQILLNFGVLNGGGLNLDETTTQQPSFLIFKTISYPQNTR